MRNQETNIEMLNRVCDFAPTGALSQIFILQAIDQFAKSVIDDAGCKIYMYELRDEMKNGFVSADAWIATAQFLKTELEAHFEK